MGKHIVSTVVLHVSDGGFDVDRLIQQRRNEINLFGIVTDPITKQRVSFPSLPLDSSSKQVKSNLSIDKDTLECKNCIRFGECNLKDGFEDICPYKKKNVAIAASSV
jgi:hypothetical protein